MAKNSETNKPWAVIIPFYNEEDYLGATLQSLREQRLRDFQLILVDNASTDRSPQIASDFAAQNPDMDIVILKETAPGQAAALKTGIAAAKSTYTAICDADTIYPPTYLAAAHAIYEKAGDEVAAVLAGGTAQASGVGHFLARAKVAVMGRLLARQCHAGGYAQTFRTRALKASGGYDRDLWPYCLKDHELVHRVSKQGALRYSFDFWCLASDRRGDRSSVRWTLYERLAYHATPYARKDWFFYEFLKPRFEARGLSELKLRERAWEGDEATDA